MMAVEKIKANEKSDVHAQASQLASAAEGTLQDRSVIQQLQNADKHQSQNRAAITSLTCCITFSCIPAHTTYYLH